MAVSDGDVPGTFALVGELDMSANEITWAARRADGSDLARVGHFTMIKIPDAEPAVVPPPMPRGSSSIHDRYTQGESEAQRRSLAERFGGTY